MKLVDNILFFIAFLHFKLAVGNTIRASSLVGGDSSISDSPSQSPTAKASITIASPSASSNSTSPLRIPACPSSAFRSTSGIKDLSSNGGAITFNLPYLPPAISSNVYVEVFLRGDYGQVYEFTELHDENSTLLGTIDPDAECSPAYHSQTFVVSQTAFNSWTTDGTVTFTLDVTSAVGFFCRNNDAYIVLCYEADTATRKSVPPSASPSVTPSSSPSGLPSSSSSATPSLTPSKAPSLPPTIPADDRNDDGDNTGPSTPIFVLGPACDDNPGCAALGLQGTCCPTYSGLVLDCCKDTTTSVTKSYYGNTKPACAAHSQCRGLVGNCCPTKDGVYLDCCD